jgi:undecaprenyl diphosphate synthase
MKMDFKEKLELNRLPEHIAIIMDGNGRWAKKLGKPRTFGHKSGVTSVRDTAEGAAEIGIKYLTLYAFSTENWKRPKFEIDALMRLLLQTINAEMKTLNDNSIRLRTMGDLGRLPKKIADRLKAAEEETESNDRMTLTLALSYSSRWEIVETTKKIIKQVENKLIEPEEIDCEYFNSQLTTSFLPDPELLIRTSGENRISNFLLWQLAYSELYFTPKLWPDFRREDLFEAIYDYQQRERRFGKTSEQLVKEGKTQ